MEWEKKGLYAADFLRSGGRRYGETISSDCSALRKAESLMLLYGSLSSRADRGAIRPYSGLNTPLFLPFGNGKKS